MTAHPRPTRRAAGFTLIELLIVLALLSVLMFLGLPSLFNMIYRSKILGVAQQSAILMRLARLEAIKTSTQTLVTIDTTAGTMTAFVDSDGDKSFDSDENQVGGLTLPTGVKFLPVSGFSSPPTPAAAVFRPNGAVLAVGAFRFENSRGDQLEARVLTLNGGRVQLQKEQGGSWIPQGEEGKVWTWK